MASSAGENGQVASLDSVRFAGTFGVTYASEEAAAKQTKKRDEMDTEGDGLLKKTRTFHVGRHNYLIKKNSKMIKKQVRYSAMVVHIFIASWNYCCLQCVHSFINHGIMLGKERRMYVS